MNIFHFEAEKAEHSALDLENHNVQFSPDILQKDTAKQAEQAEVITVFVNSKVDQVTLDQLPNLKLLVTRSTGYDHIDIAYANSKGVTVCNVPAYGSRTVAEFAYALMLALSRKTYRAIEQVKENNDWDYSEFEGFNLQGKTLGVVGTGRIGINVIQIANGFGMNVIAHDAFPNEEAAKTHGFRYTDLDELLSSSDVITLHVPATPETHHLINIQNITKFKKGSLLINTARGDVVDPEAILIGLNEGIIAGAGLDVMDGEHELKEEAELMSAGSLGLEKMKTLLEDHMLLDHPKVIITPHIAFNTAEAKQEITSATINNIERYIAGKSENVITVK